MAYPVNGGLLRWNVVDSCATCTTRWPMARQHMRNNLVFIFERRGKAASILATGCFPESSWDVHHVRREDGQAICQARAAKTSRTCEPPMFTSNG